VLAIAVTAPDQRSRELKSSEPARPLLFLADKDYPPLSYIDDAGRAAGVDVDMAKALAPVLRREVRVELMDWAVAQREVLEGRADGLLSMSVTEARSALFDFSQPTTSHDYGIFVRSGSSGINGLQDLAGLRVGVTPGGLPKTLLDNAIPARLIHVENYADGFAQLTAASLDAIAADRWVGAYTIERAGMRGIVSAGEPFARLSGGIAVRKGNTELAAEINRGVMALSQSGAIAAIQQRWRSNEEVFFSRGRIYRLLIVGGATVLVFVVSAISLWALTRRKQMYARRLLAHALKSANDCVCITDTRGNFLYANDAFLRTYEYTVKELIGKNAGIVRSNENSPELVRELVDATRGDGWRGVIQNRSKTGRVFPVALSTSAVRDGRGRVIAAVGVSRDVSKEQNLEAQLRQAQKMEAIGRLAGGVAHDFNNLLTAILGYAEMLEDRLEPSGPARADLDEISRAARSAASLTRQLLIFSRKNIVQPAVIDLNDVVGRLDRLLQRVVGEHIDFKVSLFPSPLLINADAGQIEQVVMNLVVNARDAMPAGGKLSITTDLVQREDGEFVQMTVSDSGIGMTADVRAQIFTPFFTTKGPMIGTGLGLATVHGIVEQCRGHIDVESSPGRGATFRIDIPRTHGIADTHPPTQPAVAKAAAAGTILFVEDDESIRALGARVLRQNGYTVLTARHAAEAMEISAAHRFPIDLLVTDIVMPGLHGPALSESLQRQRRELKVLYTSGYSDELAVLGQVQSTGAAFIQKPYTPDSLARKIREVMSS
jgi:PAS domain S-box-containing protein